MSPFRTTRRAFLGGLGGLLAGAPWAAGCRTSDAERPNVLFVSFDDLNDWISPLGGYRGPLHTPNFERLAARGVVFANAHCSAPACKPSRGSALTGLSPRTLGLGGARQLRDVAPDARTLPQHFRAHGYHAVGLGKVFHRSDPASWDREALGWDDPGFGLSEPVPANRPLNGLVSPEVFHSEDFVADGLGGVYFDWGPVDMPDEMFGDWRIVRAAAEVLAAPPASPLFLGVGFRKPHLPWYVPPEFFDLYPPESIVLPAVREDDLADVPAAALESDARLDLATKLRDPEVWRGAVRAYLATVSFVDRLLGELLDALDASPLADRTLVALWSDHGYQLGEKTVWRKFTLWEEVTRVPFVLALPGGAAAGGRCDEAVSLLDLYPTLAELCGLPPAPGLEGGSLAPWVHDPSLPREGAAVTRWRRDASVRTRRWRYTRYAEGGEELYDHATDPHEWVNLANDPRHAERKRELARWLETA